MSEDFAKAIIATTNKIKDLIYDTIASTRGIHAETAIAISAGLAGRFTLRQYAKVDLNTLQAGEPLFIDTVSAALENRIQEMLMHAQSGGIDPNPESGWMGALPPTTAPLKPTFELCNEFEPAVIALVSKLVGGSYDLWAQILTLVSVRVLVDVRGAIAEGDAKKLLLRSLMEGAKTVPEMLPKNP